MALAPLVTVTDLDARGIDLTDGPRVTALIASASSAVRDAAGSAITLTPIVLSLTAPRGPWLTLPVSPVRVISLVEIDSATVTDWRLRSGRLWRARGWQESCDYPSEVTVTCEVGLDEAPDDVIDLVCSLVAAGLASSTEGYDPKRGLAYERIDDYQAGMRTGGDEVVSPMLLPDSTREWLRGRFGGGVHVTGSY